jgi:hypothetical protein
MRSMRFSILRRIDIQGVSEADVTLWNHLGEARRSGIWIASGGDKAMLLYARIVLSFESFISIQGTIVRGKVMVGR